MRSKTLPFSPAILRKNLTSLWPLCALYTLLLVLVIFVPLFSHATGSPWPDMPIASYKETMLQNINRLLLSSCSGIMSLVSMAYGSLVAVGVTRYLCSMRSAAAIHAMPLRRHSIFFSGYLTGVLYLAVPHLLISIGCSIALLVGGFPLAPLFVWLYAYTVQGIFFFSLAFLCCHATGNSISAVILTLIMNFLAIVAEVCLRQTAIQFVYGLAFVGNYAASPLSPAYHLLQGYINAYTLPTWYSSALLPQFNGWAYMAALLAASAVITTLALMLYRRRHTESAGDFVAHKWLRPVFKYLFATGCALVLGWLVSSVFLSLDSAVSGQRAAIIIIFLLCGAAGLLAAEMILQKSFRVLHRLKKAMPLYLGLLLCLLLVFATDVLGIALQLPASGSIAEASIHVSGASLSSLRDEDDIRRLLELNRAIVKNHSRDTSARQTVSSAYADEQYYCTIYYTEKDGTRWRRYYALPAGADILADPASSAALVRAFVADTEVLLRTLPAKPNVGEICIYGNRQINIYGQKAAQLYQAFLQDIRDGNFTGFDGHDSTSKEWPYAFSLDISFLSGNGASQIERYGYSTQIHQGCTNLITFLQQEELWELVQGGDSQIPNTFDESEIQIF